MMTLTSSELEKKETIKRNCFKIISIFEYLKNVKIMPKNTTVLQTNNTGKFTVVSIQHG